ncbi:hypothetical protein HKX48_006550 [Thoreauomyces humboldtii]|nr:hypothetical protein HKX48_006550 [Thoreauomyces humboldtii]
MDTRTSLAIGLLLGASITTASAVILLLRTNSRHRPRKRRNSTRPADPAPGAVRDGVAGLIGNTPLFRINSLSEETGCEILAKAEFLNVGASPKDRVALAMIDEAERKGLIVPHRGDTLFEGTVGSTGISLAVISRARGYLSHIIMPDDQAQEKYALLSKLGATVEKVRPVSIVDPNHYVNLARRRAVDMNREAGDDPSRPRGFFCDQFENLANFDAHFTTTGPEVLRQTGGVLHAVVLGAGTGGTLAGMARYLKPRVPGLLTVLADPTGSGLYHKVKHGVLYSPTEAEGTRRRHQVDSVVEGVGINRLTKNFSTGLDVIDEAVRVTDREAVEMSRWLVRSDGLFVGSSSAVNCVAAVRVARQLGPGHTIVTMICDHGTRHLTKFWSDEYIASQNLTPTATGLEFLDDPAGEPIVLVQKGLTSLA